MLYGIFKTSEQLEKVAMITVRNVKELNQIIQKEFGPFLFKIVEIDNNMCTIKIEVSIPFGGSVGYIIKKIED